MEFPRHPTKTVLMDGSMGRQLQIEGMPRDELFLKIWAARALEDESMHSLVVKCHRDYITAGSTTITTNSYAVQPAYYQKAFPEDWEPRITAHHRLAAELAVEARSEAERNGVVQPGVVQVLGCLGPCCESHRPDLTIEFIRDFGKEHVLSHYTTAALALKAGGCDCLLAETMNSW